MGMTSGQVRVGLIGYGRAGRDMHAAELDLLPDKFQISAVCDSSRERREAAAAKYSCAVYDHYKALLRDPEVDLVDVASRSLDHAEMAIAALEAGKHVVVEKPMATSFAEAHRVAKAAGRSEGKLFVRHNRRFDPDFLQVKGIIDSGLLGEIHTIRLCRHGYSRRSDWQTLKKFGGGQLLNWGPHVIDHSLGFLGWKYTDMWSDLKLTAAAGDAEDHVKIVFRAESGLVVDMEISEGTALPQPAYQVYGRVGALVCDGIQTRIKYFDPKGLSPLTADPETPECYGSPDEEIHWIEETLAVPEAGTSDIWIEVYKAVRDGGRYPITVEQALQVMKVVDEVKRGTVFEK